MLEDDHREVQRALNALQAIARRVGSGQEVDPKVIGDVLLFLREFVDHCHHTVV
ncbi:MAG TPA: hypothetical protein VE439_09675 [Anaerolineae bacterium]|jgi:hemerythrin-like domain-containing protein|nr:hypothetical protein [Anaerolineae bacterium]